MKIRVHRIAPATVHPKLEKELELSMESLATNGQLGDGDDPAHCLDIDPG